MDDDDDDGGAGSEVLELLAVRQGAGDQGGGAGLLQGAGVNIVRGVAGGVLSGSDRLKQLYIGSRKQQKTAL